ncbi:glycosyltransferase [soil metagenome]
MPPSPPCKLLVVSASIGGGHVAAGRALEQAARERGIVCEHVDLLDYTTPAFRRIYRHGYFELVKSAPNFVDWLGKRLDRLPQPGASRQVRIMTRLTRGLTRLVSYRLPRHIRRYEPDALVHTHFLPPQILARLGSRPHVPQSVVLTDYAAHRLWLQPDISRYFVATEQICAHLLSTGIPAAQFEVTGIPIDLRYASLPGRAEARATLELPGRDTLLLMASGLDEGTLRHILRELMTLRRPLQVVVICGRSPPYEDLVKRELEGYDGLMRFKVLGFTTDVPLYLAAADLLLGTPGGLTPSEALAAGLPFALVQPSPIQEEAHANHLLEGGAGLRVEPLAVLAHKLKSFFDDPARQAAMREAARRGGKPGAARDVIESLVSRPL